MALYIDNCEFAGCSEPLDDRWQPENGKKLCCTHANEFEALVKANDIAGMMRFFAESNGRRTMLATDKLDTQNDD